MIHKVRAQLAATIATSGSTFTAGGRTFQAINSPLLQVLATGRDFDGVNIGGTIKNPNGATFIILKAEWLDEVCILTLLPSTALAQ